MLKVLAVDVPPPGVGLVTVTCAVPAVERFAAGTDAVTLVLLPKVVVRAVPAQFTTVPETKFEPVTVRVKAAPPAVPLVGESEVTLGSGFPFPLPPGGGGVPPPPQPLSDTPASTNNTNNCKPLRMPTPLVDGSYRLAWEPATDKRGHGLNVPQCPLQSVLV